MSFLVIKLVDCFGSNTFLAFKYSGFCVLDEGKDHKKRVKVKFGLIRYFLAAIMFLQLYGQTSTTISFKNSGLAEV